MKILGYVDVSRIKVNEEYDKLFPPLSDAEYNELYDDIRRVGTIHTNLVLEDIGNGMYNVLAGHTRLKIAKELGIPTVPCTVVETVNEKYSALFDNAARRQMREELRLEYAQKKKTMLHNEIARRLPENLQNEYHRGTLPPNHLLLCVNVADYERGALLSRLTRVEEKWLSHEETEQMYLAKIAELEENNRKTLAKIEEQYRNDIENQKERYETTLKDKENQIQRYMSDLERENKNIQKLAAEKEKKESELKQLKELQEQNKEKLKEAMAKYEATKEVISEQLRKEYEKEIAGYEEAKAKHNELIKGKDKEISQIKGELESAKLNSQGTQSELKALFEHVSAMKKTYNECISRYSNPTLVKTPLIVVNEYVENVVRLVKEHRWYKKTLEETKQLINEISNNLVQILTAMEINMVTDEFDRMADEAEKKAAAAKQAYIAAVRSAERREDNGEAQQDYDNVINFNK